MNVTVELGVDLNGEEGTVDDFQTARKKFEAAYCDILLSETAGNVSAAARLAKKDRKDFKVLLKRADIVAGEYRN